jgi:hypothetical protein
VIVDEIVGNFPVASSQEAIALNATLIDTGANTVPVTGPIRSVPVTVATLPASPVDGMRAFVTDATHSTFAAAVAGGGASHVPVYYDGGSNTWRIG